MLEYALGEPRQILESDLAGSQPVYLFGPRNGKVLYTTSVVELLRSQEAHGTPQLCPKALSFILQSGVVPPPMTIYRDLWILGIGDSVTLETVGGDIKMIFRHEFPFKANRRGSNPRTGPEATKILELLGQSISEQIDSSKPSFLFHSAGKDSNALALSLAEAGLQGKVLFLSHQSDSITDESQISQEIAGRLGFGHQKLREVKHFGSNEKEAFSEIFTLSPFPNVDPISFMLPLYLLQRPSLREANILDGGGNDSYFGMIPGPRDLRQMPLSGPTDHWQAFRGRLPSESGLATFLRSPAERCGARGLSLRDSKELFPASEPVHAYWSEESALRRNWDPVDFKTDITTSLIVAEVHIRKMRNFADAVSSNLVLPFASTQVAEYFLQFSEDQLFNRSTRENKLPLRRLLLDRLDLDANKIGKRGWKVDYTAPIGLNWDYIRDEIVTCRVWDKSGAVRLCNRLRSQMERPNQVGIMAGLLIMRLFLISGWINHNSFLSRT